MNFFWGAIAGAIIGVILSHVLFPNEKSESAMLLGGCLGVIGWGVTSTVTIQEQSMLFILKFIIPLGMFELGVMLFAGKQAKGIIRSIRPFLLIGSFFILGFI